MITQEILTSLRKKSNSADLSQSCRGNAMSQQFENNESTDAIVLDSSFEDVFQSEQFLKLPSQIFNPYRLLILIALWKWGSLDFSSLRQGAKLKTDGNLANHLRVLEELGLVDFKKEFDGRRPKTFYELTEHGKIIFLELQSIMTDMLEEKE
jgi:DNA-binding HxlR family transcriptional regulator